jgi:hypothetical protein
MGAHRNKVTDRQREVMKAARNPDPEGRTISAQWMEPVHILVERGYITLLPATDGRYQVALTEAARKKGAGNGAWRRYPPLHEPVHASGDNGDKVGPK